MAWPLYSSYALFRHSLWIILLFYFNFFFLLCVWKETKVKHRPTDKMREYRIVYRYRCVNICVWQREWSEEKIWNKKENEKVSIMGESIVVAMFDLKTIINKERNVNTHRRGHTHTQKHAQMEPAMWNNKNMFRMKVNIAYKSKEREGERVREKDSLAAIMMMMLAKCNATKNK